MENIFPGNAFRVGGDEFVIIETGIVKAQFFQKLDELRREMEKRKENFSIGVLWREGHSTTSVQAHVGLDLLPLTSFIINSIERKERQQLQWRIFSREMHSGLVETNL